ncbi:MAG TPA: hypothetical protein VLS89_01795 [Candidatus Nanopelagicales bacterium]|nr:hypothetical protein [Candidatus Nanopelagicales bacterium]
MTPEEAEATRRLLFQLENESGFWFALVVGDDARPRARLREAAETWCREHGVGFFLHAPSPERLVWLANELSQSPAAGLHWIRADGTAALIEQWDAAAAQLLLAMNERREAYRRKLDGGIVIEGRASLKRLLRELAPDLFSIRAFVAEPGSEPTTTTQEAPEWRDPIGSSFFGALQAAAVDPDRELQRAARLASIGTPEALKDWGYAVLMATMGLVTAGRNTEARQWIDQLTARTESWPDRSLLTQRTAYPGIITLFLRAWMAFNEWQFAEALDQLSNCRRILEDDLRASQGKAIEVALIGLSTIDDMEGSVHLRNGNVLEAATAFRRRIDRLVELSKTRPEQSKLDLDIVLAKCSFARALRRLGDNQRAEAVLREVLDAVQHKLLESSTDDRWQVERIACLRELAGILSDRGDLAGSIESFRMALSAAEQLAEHESGEAWRIQTQGIRSQLLNVLSTQGELAAALDVADEIIRDEQASHVLPKRRKTPALVLAAIYAQRANILLTRGELQRALNDLTTARNLVEQISFNEPSLQQGLEMMALLYASAAAVSRDAAPLQSSGRNRHVSGLWRCSIGFAEKAFRLDGGDDEVRAVLVHAHQSLAELLARQGKRRAARRSRRKARALRRTRPRRIAAPFPVPPRLPPSS